MITTVSISDLRDHLSSYVRRIRAGEEVVLIFRQQPVARMLPIEEPGQCGLSGLQLLRWSGEKPCGGSQSPRINNARACSLVLEDRD